MSNVDRSAKSTVRQRRMFQRLGDDFSFSFGITGTPSDSVYLRGDLMWSTINAAHVADGSVSDTEYQFLNGVTSAIQTQIDSKITGPGSSTDNAVVRYDGTTGKLAQNSIVFIDDSGNLSTIGKGTFGAATSGFDIGVNSATLAILNAVGSVTNIPIVIQPQGTGSTIAQVPDSTSTGGNARGARAVDFQRLRTAASQVASGSRACIPAGQNNTASGTNSLCVGLTNVASASQAVAIGQLNTSAGADACTIGNGNTVNGSAGSVALGATNIVDGDASVGLGQENTVNGDAACAIGFVNTVDGFGGLGLGVEAFSRLRGQLGLGFGARAALGDKMFSVYGLSATTANATPEELFLDGDAGSARLTIPSGKAMAFVMIGLAYTGTADGAFFVQAGAIKNNAGATALIGAVVPLATGADAALATATLVPTADNTNDALAITATGVAATTIHWVATILATEVA